MSKKRFVIVSTLAFIVAFYVLLVTRGAIAHQGTASLLGSAFFSEAFDSLSDNLQQGSVHVDPKTIDHEGFFVGEKTTIYFGLFPALLRFPVNYFFPEQYGNWAKISVLLAGIVALLAGCGIFMTARKKGDHSLLGTAVVLFSLLAFGLGTPLVFLVSEAYIYHEAIIWGLALSLCSLFFLVRSFKHPATVQKGLFLTSTFAGFALLGRASFALPLLLIIGTLFLYEMHQRRLGKPGIWPVKTGNFELVVLLLLPLGLCFFLQFAYNYARFGDFLTFIDFSYYTRHPDVVAFVHENGAFNPQRMIWSIENYLLRFSPYFSQETNFLRLIPANKDPEFYTLVYIEHALPVPLWNPLFFFTTLAALLLPLGKNRSESIVLTCLLVQWLVIFCHFFISHRYSAEFIPLLVLGNFIFLRWVLRKDYRFKVSYCTLAAPLVAVAVYINVTTTLSWSAYDNWASPGDKKELIRLLVE